MSDVKKIRKVSINTVGLSRDEILKCVENHVVACQKALADLYIREGESEEVTNLREAFSAAQKHLSE